MAHPPPRRIEIRAGADGLAEVVATLGLPARTTTVVVNGETGDNPGFPAARVREVLRSVVRQLSVCPGPVIISGGTRAGVFALLDEVVHELGFPGPVVGVVPAGQINRPEGTPLATHHTDVLMVAGDAWGDETSFLLALCRELDRRGPMVALVAGGGRQTLVEVEGHLVDRRSVVVLQGTGRAADDLAAQSPPHQNVIVCDVRTPDGRGPWRSVLQAGEA